jgi:deoxycytidine triphosphate deaminase
MPSKCNQLLNFPKNEDEAEAAYLTYRDLDPFPDIDSALLNAADIADYVAKTGMIFPFDLKRLGPASYEMVLGGETLYWDDEEKKCGDSILQNNAPLILGKNSITYVSVRETFRLPHYIAVRFNLRVRHVHRGLLLGTGPLVDPGFQGNLMIPVHNLTENEYIIREGEDIISVEFTKVSRNPFFSPKNDLEKKLIINQRQGAFVVNSKKNSKKSFEELLKKELPIGIGKVMSSLAGTLAKTKKLLEENQGFIEKIKKYSLIAIFPIIIALVALYIDIKSYVANANKYVADATMIYKSDNKIDIRSITGKEDLERIKEELQKIEESMKTTGGDKKNTSYQLLKQDINELKLKLSNLEKLILSVQEQQKITKENEQN